jgi:XTP/dITP diphosphohydrolase
VFRCAVALCLGGEVRVFVGETRGRIAEEPRGGGGFGYDPIFIPEGSSLTYAEMGEEAKNAVSHRGRAFAALARWLISSNF